MNKVKLHTVEQPNSDTTTFVLSCNRLDLLERTMESFLSTRDYKTKMVIVDDSAEEGVFEILLEKYGSFSDIICFPRNRSQWWAMDFMVSYCDSEYIFYLEEDWEFTKSGYLTKSKEILKKYREIGTVDISNRTFEWQGIDSYEKELIDGEFYWKKPWKISDYHLHWYGWIGSPNLKRREDLVRLGRVELWHNEWNIDRKFYALGYRAVFLKDEYLHHLGDNRSSMEGKRPNDGTTPESYYPPELQKNRVWPANDYLFLDTHWRSPWEVTMVTAMLDIGRDDRNFDHYLNGIEKVLQCRNPMVVYAEPKYHHWIKEKRGTLPLQIKTIAKEILEKQPYFSRTNQIVQSEEFQTRSDWIKGSALCNPWYIPLTLYKMAMLTEVADTNPFHSKKFYWIDSGICSSYNINEHIDTFNFNKLPDDTFFLTSYPYWTDSEIHGYPIESYGTQPGYVCRASLFGGTKDNIIGCCVAFYDELYNSIDQGIVGTEESIFTKVSHLGLYPITRFEMPNGDIKNYLNTIRSR